MNKITEAELEFKKLVQESPDQRIGWENLAWLSMYRGRYREALTYQDRIIEVATKETNKSPLGGAHAERAFWFQFLLGDRVSANKEIEKAIEFQQTGNAGFYFALLNAYLEIGEYEKARSIAKNQLSSIVTSQKIENQINALTNKRANNFGSAIESFEALHPGKATLDEKNLFDLAQCYLAINQPEKAIDKLQKIQGSYNNYWKRFAGDYWSTIYPKSFYLLGEAYEQKNDNQHASEAYQKLLTIWKDADKDIPEYVNVKVRLAKLKGMTTR
jgi:tetratricopeptide (TPR) repeat protein